MWLYFSHMNLTYTNRIIDNEAFILLNDEITPSNASMIAEEMYWHKANNLSITLKINSPGGHVIAGFSILDAVLTTEANTHIIGIAASMAGIIYLVGNKRKANTNATLMIHPPSGGGHALLEIIRTQLKNLLTGRSNLSEDEVTSLMAEGGKDNFYDIDQMQKMGIVDEVIDVNRRAVVKNNNPKELYAIYNKIITEEKKMDLKEIKNTLNLSQSASEERVIEAVAELKQKYSTSEEQVKSLSEEKAELEAKVKEFEQKETEMIENRAKELVEGAIADGRIQEDMKDSWLSLAKNSYDTVKKTFDGLKKDEQKMFSVADLLDDKKGVKAFKDMTEEEKAKLARENPEAYNKALEKEDIK